MKRFNLPVVKCLAPCAVVTALFISSCTPPSTPQTRIEENPTIIKSLPESQQKAVATGSLTEGMSKNAVFLAWGNPDRKFESFSEGSKTEKWIYTKLKPVYRQRLSTGVSYGRGFGYNSGYNSYSTHRYGCSSRYGHSFGIGTSVSYVPTPAASVTFKNDRVSSWQLEK